MNGTRSPRGGYDAPLPWRMGLINSNNKYLTAEAFGFKVNVTGGSLRKKQIWTLEFDPKEHNVIFIKSHLNRYLSSDPKGNVHCTSETKGVNEQWTVEYRSSGLGKWALRNNSNFLYLGCSNGELLCDSKDASTENEWWTAQLAVHPQISIRNVNRDRFSHLSENEILCNEVIPWGADALITLEFKNNKYAVKTCDNRYLRKDGRLVQAYSKDTLYMIEIKTHPKPALAFKDCDGLYLTHATASVMQSLGSKITKDEMFILEDNQPQVTMMAHNGKYVSIRQGEDITTNQMEVGDSEIFQMEFDKLSKLWRIRTCMNKFWNTNGTSGVKANCQEVTIDAYFTFEWQEDGRLAIKTGQGRYLGARLAGSVSAQSTMPSEKELFRVGIVNRPIVVLRCDYGFVGFKSSNSTRLECNKSIYEISALRQDETGRYHFLASNGKYWRVTDDGTIEADGDRPEGFYFEFHTDGKLAIRAQNGKYLKGEQSGLFTATGLDISNNTLWEF